ncbi:MAG: hypothetical protein ABGY75_07485 [Gemmataceae bacterium]
MRRVRVIALWVIGAMTALLIIAWLGLKGYLASSSARGLAAAKIGETLGMAVEVESLDVGLASTTATVRIPDAAADTPGDLIRIGSLTTDITLGDLLAGRVNPTRVTAKDVDLLLRIDADGNILSPLPKRDKPGGATGPLPTVEVTSARVRIHQTGKPVFDLAGVSGQLKPDGDGSVISGAVDDPKWGKWKLSGKLAANPAAGHVELSTDQGVLSDPLLRSIPYVPPVVWEHLSAAATTAAVVTFSFRPDDDLRFSVDLRPNKASLTVPDADVTATEVEGRIRIDGEKVTVDGGALTLADGRMTVSGTYQFDRPTAIISLKLTAKGVDVRHLPTEWGLPKEITGRLKGTAALELRIPLGGKLETLGSGSGELEDAKFAGLPAEIKLNLRGGGGRYRFDTTSPGR